MKNILISFLLLAVLLTSCSDTNELPPDISGTSWNLYTFLDPPGVPGTAVITFNESGTITSIPATVGNTWFLDGRDITIKYTGSIEYRGQLKNADTLMAGTIYKAGNPNGFWSASLQ